MGDFSIATMSTEAVDSLEAKCRVVWCNLNTGPHQRPGIISNLFSEPGWFFPALPTRNLDLARWRFFSSAAADPFSDWIFFTLFVICLLIASRAAFRSAVSQLGISEGRTPCGLR